jgi:hypothetical protein
MEREAASADIEAHRAQVEATQRRITVDRRREEAEAMHEMARRDTEDLLHNPLAPPTGNATQEPPRSAGGAGSADDTGTHHSEDMDWWMDDLHLGSDHGADTEYNHGSAPPRFIHTVIRDSGNTVAGLDEDKLL